MTPVQLLVLIVLISIATVITWIIFNPRRAKRIACTLLKVLVVVAVLVVPVICTDNTTCEQRPVLLPLGQLKDMPVEEWGGWIAWWMQNDTWPVNLTNVTG